MRGRTNLYPGGNEGFLCENCGTIVLPLVNGSVRNHCPECFHSKHLDITPGDRASDCFGIMIPERVDSHPKKGYQLLHRCLCCGALQRNKLALDDSRQPDNFDVLLDMMRRHSEGFRHR